MRLSQHFGRTLREAPADGMLTSHALMARAGLVRPIAPGSWATLPLGWRAMQRLQAMVRKDLNRLGTEEASLPTSAGAPVEEVVTELAQREVQSYKDLPRAIYQIGSCTDEDMRGGLIRLREQTRLAVFSLHAETADLHDYQERVNGVLQSLFAHCQIGAIRAEAFDESAWAYLHAAGDMQIVRCNECGYTAPLEAAVFSRGAPATAELLHAEKVATPECKTIADLCKYLSTEPAHTLKAVFITINPGMADTETILVMLRGDLDVSEAKLVRIVNAQTLITATEEDIRARIGAEPGYASPIGLNVRGEENSTGVRVIGDESLTRMANFVTGANEVGYHVVNANIPRDFSVTRIADIALAQDGATCVRCGGTLRAEPAVELAHCVKVGAVSIKQGGIVTYLNANGHAQPVMLGRCMVHLDGVMQAIVEEHHDEQGIVWPRAVAPYEVHLVAIAKDEASAQAAETLYGELRASGVEVLYDDRNLSPGVMFADADLMGIPLRLTVSPRSLDSDGIEAKWRWESERTMIPLAEAVEQVRRLMEKSR